MVEVVVLINFLGFQALSLASLCLQPPTRKSKKIEERKGMDELDKTPHPLKKGMKKRIKRAKRY
jgi:hypothetical protein